MEPLILVDQVTKAYRSGTVEIQALRNISLSIDRGRMASITGRSGSGKSTLLNVLTGIDRPSRGIVRIAGTSPVSLTENELAVWRGRTIGIVFQFFQLLPTLTVAENVILPMDFCNTWPAAERKDRALALLERVGIAEQAQKFPSSLSGGQQQRAAIARALANDPPILVADEPTGNLDSRTARSIFSLFQQLAAGGKTIVVVTHETEFDAVFDQRIELEDGTVLRSTEPQENTSCALVS
ncbi:MAG TPA: ABC transporter ATP-binding protein [Thermoanaerobaculia bacterium]|nr:ABC transporter ATP-binding protein [Thermoanaerobaculia bacterium]